MNTGQLAHIYYLIGNKFVLSQPFCVYYWSGNRRCVRDSAIILRTCKRQHCILRETTMTIFLMEVLLRSSLGPPIDLRFMVNLTSPWSLSGFLCWRGWYDSVKVQMISVPFCGVQAKDNLSWAQFCRQTGGCTLLSVIKKEKSKRQ
jgi:hypothetical protein